MNAIFICVIVLVKMCFHMLNLCWFKRKNIFECFKCFWKVLCFYKNWKISKTVLPYFGNSIAGHPSHMLRPRARGLILATCSRVKGPFAKGTQRFSWLSSRLPHRLTFQSWKTLRKFFIILTLSVLAACPSDLLATHPSREKCVFGKKWVSFLKTFQFSLELFMTIHFLSQLELIQTLRVTLYKLHFCTCSPPNL